MPKRKRAITAPKAVREEARELRRVFMDAHRHGTRALRSGDLKGFSDAIAVERSLIDEQREVIEQQLGATRWQRDFINGDQPPAAGRKRRARKSAGRHK